MGVLPNLTCQVGVQLLKRIDFSGEIVLYLDCL